MSRTPFKTSIADKYVKQLLTRARQGIIEPAEASKDAWLFLMSATDKLKISASLAIMRFCRDTIIKEFSPPREIINDEVETVRRAVHTLVAKPEVSRTKQLNNTHRQLRLQMGMNQVVLALAQIVGLETYPAFVG